MSDKNEKGESKSLPYFQQSLLYGSATFNAFV
jgi:hypothetical protein